MKGTLSLICTLACVCVLLLEAPTQAINFLVIAQTNSSKNKSDAEIRSIAKKITVQILEANSQQQENSIGTGFIVKKQNQNYQVLTNDHVISKLQSGYQYQIKTYDDRIYKASLYKKANNFNNYDLAILTFSSSVGYQTAKLGNSYKLQPEEKVFVAGFPCESTLCKPKLIIKSGVIAPIEFLLQKKTLIEGYRIGYDIDVQSGTSGGPIINTIGEVVGVNGRSKSVESPFANTPDQYTFTDKSQPNKNIKLLMRYFAWGIPIEYTKLDGNTSSQIENTPRFSALDNVQNNSEPNLQTPAFAPNNSLIIIFIILFILVIIWLIFNQWNQRKNDQKFKFIEDKQKELDYYLSLYKEANNSKFQAIEDKQKELDDYLSLFQANNSKFQAIEDKQKELDYHISFNQGKNQLRFQKIEENQKQQTSNFASEQEEMKQELETTNNFVLFQKTQIDLQEQKLTTLQENFQQLVKALREVKKYDREKLQNTSSREEQDK